MQLSYFVVPSVIWYFSKKEKDNVCFYKEHKLRSIDCKHFDFGNGTCPFGTSCFYKHKVQRGSHMWKTAVMPEVYGSRSLVIDEQESSSILETESLRLLFELLNASNMAVGLDEFVGSLSNEDIESEIAEALAFELMFERLGLSDSEIDDDINIF
ncbi:hypothetical protein Leryth_002149 [Lithospermum erythrorhizon]|nr:hypothetical protein Leryth_002149 [Lithospermum erythrorhizon]